MIRRLILILLLISIPQLIWADGNVLYTSTRYVTGIAFAGDGTLWVATRGGVLHRNADGSWRKFTVADGLPSNEAQRIITYPKSDSVLVDFPGISAEWSDGRWTQKKMIPMASGISVINPDDPVKSSEPHSDTGTHISAWCKSGGREITAMFGDGLYEYVNDKWTRMNIDIPEKAREITAVASENNTIWIGTRREGIWEYNGKTWAQYLQPDEPYDHNIHCIAAYGENMFFSTLEDGLVVKTPNEWQHISKPDISSNAPRQMAVFGGALYVRHGNGKVDRLDGNKWTKDICRNNPRKQVSTIASDDKNFYIGQWGGWSEFDGKTWTPHLKLSELQGCTTTAILPQKNAIWIGTQGRGLAEVDRANGTIRMHDERNGLTDDWITCLACVGDTIYMGTFVGGLFVKDGDKWKSVFGIDGAEITDLSSDGNDNLFITTRSGVWRRATDGTMSRMGPNSPEAQAVCPNKKGIWIGTRTGIWFSQDY